MFSDGNDGGLTCETTAAGPNAAGCCRPSSGLRPPSSRGRRDGANSRRVCLRILLFVALLAVGGAGSSAQESEPAAKEASERVGYLDDVQPILATHCFRCHSDQKQEGDLRLDQRIYLDRGGHTGNPLVADTLEQSELYVRITSPDDTLRMPKESDPLSDQEIKVLTQWIQQGAPYEVRPVSAMTASRDWLFESADMLHQRYLRHVLPVVFAYLAFLVIVLVAERCKKRYRRAVETGRGGPQTAISRLLVAIDWRHMAGVTLLAVAAGAAFYFNGTRAVALADRDRIKSELDALHSQLNGLRPGAGQPAFVYRPQHPRRLGGTYYRGNDERSPQLFNGGFYRTATLELSLCYGDGQTISYDDAIEGKQLFVRLTINRAPFATPSLFSDYIMNSSYLSTQVTAGTSLPIQDEPVYFDATTPGEVWEARYPIEINSDGDNGKTAQGAIYVYKGGRDDRVRDPDDVAHYAIDYELVLADGKISRQSSLAMGSMFHTGNVMFTPDDRIPASEWFGFQEIPEIVGGNTSDPKLLGIDEHLPEGTVDR